MTPSAYLWRKVKRLKQRHPDVERLNSQGYFVVTPALLSLWGTEYRLRFHVTEKVGPSVTDTLWRSKRDGGPYRLDFGT